MNFSRFCSGLLATALLLLAGCSTKKAKPRLGEVERYPSLETVYPKYTNEKIKVELLATVDPFEKADLCSQVQGEVKNLSPKIDIDYPIHKGETLVTLDVPGLKAELEGKSFAVQHAHNLKIMAEKAREVAMKEVQEAQAKVKRYDAEVSFRELQYKRVRTLAARDTVSQQLKEEQALQLDAARAALDEAKTLIATKTARLDAAKTDVEVAMSRQKVADADLDLAKAKVNFATITAPFDGVITKRWVDNGATIKDPTMPLLTVMHTDVVRVLVDVPERYVPSIRAKEGRSSNGHGNEVQLQISCLAKDWKPSQGYVPEITRIGPALDSRTRLLRAEIHLPNPGRVLKPGMTGKAVVILDDGKKKRLTIPSTALVRVGKEMRVYYIANPRGNPLHGEVQSTVVTLGLDDGKTVEIKSGLTSKELVIAKGNGVLPEGTAIAVNLRETKH
jgi:RND family efflux transporter MFP subunit